MEKKSRKTRFMGFFICVVLVICDQLTKYLAVLYLKGKKAIPIIDEVFELQYLENRSAAFGMDPISFIHRIFSIEAFHKDPALFLKVKMMFFVILTIVLVISFIFIYIRIPEMKKYRWMDFVLLLLISGATGNFIDRVCNHYVVDFFYFKLINFPIFNVADIYVTVAAFLMIFLTLFYYKEDDFEKVFPKKNKKVSE